MSGKSQTKSSPARLVTKREYARLRGVAPSLITKRIHEGVLTTEGPTELIDVDKADQALADALGAPRTIKRGSTAARPGSGRRTISRLKGGLSLHEARTIRAREDAERSRIAREREQIELDKLRGTVVSIADSVQVLGEVLSKLRSKVLGLPHRIAPEDPVLRRMLTEACREMLVELVEYAEAQAAAAESVERAAGDDAEPGK